MKKKWLSILLIIIGCLITTSCGAPSSNQTTEETPPTAQIPPEPTQPQPEPIEETTSLDNQDSQSQERVAVSGLIPPINPQERREAIARGTNDPFQPISTTPSITIRSNPDTEQGQDSSGQNNNLPPEPPPETSAPAPETTEVEPESEEAVASLAREVIITGIVEVGDTIQVIVKAPKEEFSRYVELGQYISNGQILVKAVEQIDRFEPVVILEESGIEVRRKIGENSTTQESPEQPSVS